LRIPHLDVLPGERIAGFKLEITAGVLHNFGPLPNGWFLSVANKGTPWSEVDGSVQVGAAASTPTGSAISSSCSAIRSAPARFRVGSRNRRDKDFDEFRTLHLGTADFELHEVGK